jgi:pyruvate dehydrogenase E2 component (dihydrolipoyllysine-residue acetyltransferase)
MSNEITMPKLSDTMEEGKIIRWLKHPGDAIRRGEPIAEVETDKADMVMEAFDDGVLGEIKLKEGESAPVGAVIALMAAEGEQPAAEPRADQAGVAGTSTALGGDGQSVPAEGEAESAEGGIAEEGPEFHPAMSAHPSATPTAMPKPPRRLASVKPRPPAPQPSAHADGQKFRASPLARRAAEEAQVDLSGVRGTGPDGRITKRDVDNFLREQQLFRVRRLVSPAKGAPGAHEELSKMRKTIAMRMAASKREIPHFYVTVEIDMEEAARLKKSIELTELFEEDITYNDIIVKATALALGRYPRVNASYENGGITIRPHINIGMAVAVEDGLIVPVIRECERLTLPEISRVSHRLVAKAARGGFTSDELSGATFTISNMGMLEIEHFAAVINPPQAAVLAVSAIKDRPVVRGGHLGVGKTMMVTVSCDHRIVDGVVAGRFLQELKRFLENPASLLV